MNGSVLDIRTEFLRRIAEVRNRKRLAELSRGAALTLLAAPGVALVLLLLEGQFRFGPGIRTGLVGTGALLVLVLLAVSFGVPLLKRMRLMAPENDEEIAGRIGGEFPDIRDRLLNALQLCSRRPDGENLYSADLIDRAIRETYDLCAHRDFSTVVRFSSARRLALWAGMMWAAGLILFAAFPSFLTGSATRLWHSTSDFEEPAPFHLVVTPGDADVVRGDTVPLVIRAEGPAPVTVVLSTRRDGETAVEEQVLKRETDGTYRHAFTAIKASISYAVRAERVESPIYRLNVIDRPALRSLRVSLRFPAYSRIPPRDLPLNVGDVTALRGTQVTLSVESGKTLSSAWARFDGESLFGLRVEGTTASGTFRLMKEQTYQVILRDSQGIANADPITFFLTPLADAPPVVSILFPGPAIDVADNTVLPLLVKASDDYGFTRLRLRHRLAQSRYEPPQEQFAAVELALPPGGDRELNLSHRWDLSKLSLAPQDVVEYYVEAFDNDGVRGPQIGVSDTYVLRLPALEEILAAVDQQHDQALAMMESTLKEAEDARRKLAGLQQDLKRAEQRADWQERKKSDELVKKYEEVRKQIDAVNETMDQMVAGMEQNRLLSPETLRKYEELQELMQQMNSAEFSEAMKRLQEAMQNLNPEEMQRALQRLAVSEEDFRKNLERTINLLKRIQIEQKLDEILRRSEQMQKAQEDLRSAMERPNADSARSAMARRQEDLAQETARLEEELNSLQKRMAEFPGEMPVEQMRQAGEDLENAELEKRLQETARHIEAGESSQALAGQRSALQEMARFTASMQAAKKALQEGQMQQIVNAMKGIERDLLELSRRQEELRNESRALESSSPRFRENAQEQSQVSRDLGNVAERLSGLSQKTFSVSPEMGRSLGEAFRQMNESLRSLEQRNGSQAAQQQEAAMASMNEAAQQMQAALNGMMQGGGGGIGMAGLMQRLQQLSGRQQQLNRETGGMSPGQAAELGRLAAEQGALRKSLEQLAREASSSGQSSRLLGDLRTIAEEMREVQTDLAQGELTGETLKRQERILSRLLDSQRSTRERDFEKRRKSETGTDVARRSVPQIVPPGQDEKARLRRDLLKALEEGYARDYQELIRKYFEALDR